MTRKIVPRESSTWVLRFAQDDNAEEISSRFFHPVPSNFRLTPYIHRDRLMPR
jgi:hypothetical protein